MVSLLAGGSGRGEVRQLLAQVAAALPGFDVGVRVRIITPWPSAIAGAGAAVLLAVAAVWVGRVVPDGARPADLPPALLAVLLVAVAAASRCSRCAAGASGPRVRRGQFPVPDAFPARDHGVPRRRVTSGVGPAAAVPAGGQRVPRRAGAAHRAGRPARRGRIRRRLHRLPGCSARPARPRDRAAARRRRRTPGPGALEPHSYLDAARDECRRDSIWQCPTPLV